MDATRLFSSSSVTLGRGLLAAAVLGLALVPAQARAEASLAETSAWLKEHVLAWNAYDDIKDVAVENCYFVVDNKNGSRIKADLRGEENVINRVQHGEHQFDVALRPHQASSLVRYRQEGGAWVKDGNPAIFQISISAKRGEGVPEESKAGQLLDALQHAAKLCHNQPAGEHHQGLK